MPLQQAEIAGIILGSAVTLFATLIFGLLFHRYLPCLSRFPDVVFFQTGPFFKASIQTQRHPLLILMTCPNHFAGNGDSDSISYEGSPSDLFTIPTQSRRVRIFHLIEGILLILYQQPMSMFTTETASMYSIDSAPPELHDHHLPRRTKSRGSLRSYITYNRSALELEEVVGQSQNSSYSGRFHAGLPLPPIPLVASVAPPHVPYPKPNRNIRPLPLVPVAKQLSRPSVFHPHLREIDE